MVTTEIAPPRGVWQQARSSGLISHTDFWEWLDSDLRAEWVNGEVVVHMPPQTKHQRVIKLFLAVLGWFAQRHALGAVIFDLRLKYGGMNRVVDLAFVAGITEDELPQKFLTRPADLVIEVVSPESVERDYQDKREEYAAGGVPEYWIADLVNDAVTFLQLESPGAYQEAFPDADGLYAPSVLPGLRFPAEWLLNPVSERDALEWLKLAVPYERYEVERLRAENASRDAERLARFLRSLGYDPDTITGE